MKLSQHTRRKRLRCASRRVFWRRQIKKVLKAAVQLKIAMFSVHSCRLGKPGAKDTGGMSVYIRELCRELGRWGHMVDIYTRAHEPVHEQIAELDKNARLVHLRAGQEEEIDKLAIYPHLADFAREVESFRRQNGLHYDLIHSHYWLSGRVGQWLVLLNRGRLPVNGRNLPSRGQRLIIHLPRTIGLKCLIEACVNSPSVIPCESVFSVLSDLGGFRLPRKDP